MKSLIRQDLTKPSLLRVFSPFIGTIMEPRSQNREGVDSPHESSLSPFLDDGCDTRLEVSKKV